MYRDIGARCEAGPLTQLMAKDLLGALVLELPEFLEGLLVHPDRLYFTHALRPGV